MYKCNCRHESAAARHWLISAVSCADRKVRLVCWDFTCMFKIISISAFYLKKKYTFFFDNFISYSQKLLTFVWYLNSWFDNIRRKYNSPKHEAADGSRYHGPNETYVIFTLTRFRQQLSSSCNEINNNELINGINQ